MVPLKLNCLYARFNSVLFCTVGCQCCCKGRHQSVRRVW